MDRVHPARGHSGLDREGLHRELSRPARRRPWDGGFRSDRPDRANLHRHSRHAGRPLSAGRAPSRRPEPGRGLPPGRSGRIRARAAGGHRPRRHVDGLGHRVAAPARRALRRHHDARVPGAPQLERRSGQRRTQTSGRTAIRRRSVDTRPAAAVRRHQGPRRSRAAAAQGPVGRATGRQRRGRVDRHPERPGRRRRNQRARPLLGPRPRRRRRPAALAGQRQLSAAGLPAVPRARRPGLGRRLTWPGCPAHPHRFPPPVDRRRQAAGARAVRRRQLPAIRRLPVRHRGTGERRRPSRRAPLRRALHRRRHERRRSGDPYRLDSGSRRACPRRQRPDPSRPTAPRCHPNRPALRAFHAERRAALSDGQSRGGSGIPTAGVVVPARGPAPILRVLPGLSAPRPLHHPGAAADRRHPGPRVRRHAARVHRPSQRIALGSHAFHGAAARRGRARRRLRGKPYPHPGVAERGRPDLDRPVDRRGGAGPRRAGRRRALRDGLPRGLQAGRHPGGRHRPHRHHRRAAGQFGQVGVLRTRRRRRAPADLVPGWAHRLAEPAVADAAEHGRGGARGAAVHRGSPGRAAGVDLPVQDLDSPHHLARNHDGGTRGDGTAIRRRGHRDLGRPGRDRPLQRAGDARAADLAAGRAAARLREILAAGGLSLQPVLHRVGAGRAPLHRAIAGRPVRGAFRPPPVGSVEEP